LGADQNTYKPWCIIKTEVNTVIQDNHLLNDFYTLSPDKQAEAIDFIQRLKQSENAPSRKWQEIAGCFASPLVGEDAQGWISRQRQDADRQISDQA
jgi:hypothetical protein